MNDETRALIEEARRVISPHIRDQLIAALEAAEARAERVEAIIDDGIRQRVAALPASADMGWAAARGATRAERYVTIDHEDIKREALLATLGVTP